MMKNPHRIVIVGGGFGGLAAARALSRAPAQVTLVDRRNFHLFQPLLYQVATGELSPANIASPLRSILRRQKNCSIVLDTVIDFDIDQKRVILEKCQLEYDSLIVAAGSRHSYFGHDEWEPLAPGLKSVEDAIQVRQRILYAFEAAERESDPQRRNAWLTFVIVGGGPTGIELAGAIAEIAHHTMKFDFRRIDPAEARIFVIDAGERPLAAFPPKLSEKAEQALEKLGATILSRTKVTDVTPEHVVIHKDEVTETVPTRTVIWAAGVAASPLGQVLANKTGAETDRAGRIIVAPDLSLPGHPEIFVIGDLALYRQQNGEPLPGLAPVAMQQGRHVAKLLTARLRGQSMKPFRYRDHGTMAVIGRYAAVAQLGGRELTGFVAWLAWLLVHLMEITQFRNRVLVLIQWGWTYLTRDRAARLITGALPNSTHEAASQNVSPPPPHKDER